MCLCGVLWDGKRQFQVGLCIIQEVSENTQLLVKVYNPIPGTMLMYHTLFCDISSNHTCLNNKFKYIVVECVVTMSRSCTVT